MVDEHGRIGPEVAAVDIGMPLALHWKLTNESAAYGFHVRNCAVADTISGVDMMVVDEQGSVLIWREDTVYYWQMLDGHDHSGPPPLRHLP